MVLSLGTLTDQAFGGYLPYSPISAALDGVFVEAVSADEEVSLDFNPNMPASLQFIQYAYPEETFLTVNRQEGLMVFASYTGPLYLGSVVDFAGTRGIVTKLLQDGRQVEVRLSRQATVTRGRLVNLLKPSAPEFIYFHPFTIDQLGVLHVVCKVNLSHKPGRISWTLTHKADSSNSYAKVASGHDYDTPSICRLDGLGTWQPGSYKLSVALLSDSLAPINLKHSKWSIKEAKRNLTAGRINDVKAGPLLTV